MMFYLYLDMGFTGSADTEQEAREQAKQWFIKALEEERIDFMLVNQSGRDE